MPLSVVIAGAGGQMGREVVRAVHAAPGMEVVGGVDPGAAGQDLGELAGLGRWNLPVAARLGEVLQAKSPRAMVDFTVATAAFENALVATRAGVPVVIGTTGLSETEVDDIRRSAEAHGVGVVLAPNFAIGAVLLMQFAEMAARFFPAAEIIELHHEKKKDSPSGTAVATAERIQRGRTEAPPADPEGAFEKVAGSRGGSLTGVHIHSVRLPGLVAHQEVIFGLPGQTLTIRHDSLHRESFMPGVLLAVRRVQRLRGLVYGLESLLFEEA